MRNILLHEWQVPCQSTKLTDDLFDVLCENTPALLSREEGYQNQQP